MDAGLWIAPKLGIVKSSLNLGAAKPGTQLRYQIVISNAGPTLSRNVVLTDPIPADTTYVDGSAAPAAALIDNKLEWRIGDLKPGDVVTVTFAAKVVEEIKETVIRNTALLATDDTTIVVNSNEVQNPTSPTAVALDEFMAELTTVGGLQTTVVRWRTALELNTLGFNVWRSATESRRDAVKVNATLIAAKGASGGVYRIEDADGTATSRYWIEEIELSGNTIDYGPALVGVPVAVRDTVPGIADNASVAQVALVPAAPQPGAVVVGELRNSVVVPQTVVNGSAVAVIVPSVGTRSSALNNAAPVVEASTNVAPVAPLAQPEAVAPTDTATGAAGERPAVAVDEVTDGQAAIQPNGSVARGSSEPGKLILPVANPTAARPDAPQRASMLVMLSIFGMLLIVGAGLTVCVGALRRKRNR